MGGDATENVEGCRHIARKCLERGNAQAQSMSSLQRAYGPWRGRGHAGPGTARPMPALRFFEHVVPPWELSLPCGAGWASTACFLPPDIPGKLRQGLHVIFSPSRGSNQGFSAHSSSCWFFLERGRPPCGIFSKPWHQSGLLLPTPRVVGFSSRQVATVRDFHQAMAPAWTFLFSP